MSDPLLSFAREMDRCWTEGRFDDLGHFLADDVIFVAPDGEARLEGRGGVIDSYRTFTASRRLRRFEATDHAVTRRGPVAIVEYRWEMVWETGEAV